MAAAVLEPYQHESLYVDPSFTQSKPAPSPTTNVQRWDGNERTATEWNSLRRDSELWFDDGECYVYLYQPGHSQRGPSFRLPYEMVAQADCNDLLDQHLISTWNSSPYSPSCPGGECYLYLHAPVELSRDEAFRYHLDTRNFFAWMAGVPLVGIDPISALVRLKDRLDAWRDRPSDNLGALINYIKMQGYCDLPEPMELSFTHTSSRGLPSPRKRRDSFKRMFKLPGTGHVRRVPEIVVPANQVTKTLSAMGPQAEGKRLRHHEIVIPEYGNGVENRRGSESSMSSDVAAPPSLTDSRDVSTSSPDSSVYAGSSPPSAPRTPDIPSRSSSFRKTGMAQGDYFRYGAQIKVTEEQDVIIDALIEELTDGQQKW